MQETTWHNRIAGYGTEAPDHLVANPRNWRVHPTNQQAALKGSLTELGWIQNVIVNQRTGFVVDGHARIALALRHDQPEVPVTYVDLSEAEEALALATLDPISAMAGADKDQLEALLTEITTQDEALLDLVAGLGKEHGIDLGGGGLTAPDEVPEPPAEPITKPGDLWLLGEHRIACLDATDAEAVKRLLVGATPDMVFADPPYGIDIVNTSARIGGPVQDIPFGGVKNRKGLGTANGSKPFGSKAVRGTVGASNMVEAGRYFPIIGDDSTDTALAAYVVASDLAPKAVHIWWGGNYYANALPPSPCWIVWDKENTGNFADAELAWTNQKTAVRIFRHQWNGLLRASERGERRVHPTQKPVALAAWCFEEYGKAGDLIYDPLVGSGITIIAAEQTDRRVYGCELSPDYCDVIVRRWETFTGQTASRERIEDAA